jgi:hypothetical protein
MCDNLFLMQNSRLFWQALPLLACMLFSAGCVSSPVSTLPGLAEEPTHTAPVVPFPTATPTPGESFPTSGVPEISATPEMMLFTVEPHFLNAEAYFVSPDGDDANPGTLEQPWRTIQKAADTLTSGKTVYLRAGTYSERVLPQHSGSPGHEITFAAYPGEIVTLDGTDIELPDDLAGLFDINGLEYIRVVGLRLVNAGPYRDNAGIMVRYASQITLQDNATYNTQSSGIGVWDSQDIIIDGNTVERAGLSGYQECITVAITGIFEVLNNIVTDCEKEGITLKDGSHNGQVYQNRVEYSRHVGIYVDAEDKHTHDIQVYQNIVFGTLEKAGIVLASEQGGLLERIRVENNLSYGNFTYGIEISSCCSEQHPMRDLQIINNTLYHNGYDWKTGAETGWGGGIIADNPQAQNVLIRNNIASQNLTFQIAVAVNVPQGGLKVDHNLIDGYRSYEDEIYGEDYVEGNPLFIDPANGDFHLQQISPAIDAGTEVDAPGVDFEGDLRPQGIGIDVGADEVIYAVE